MAKLGVLRLRRAKDPSPENRVAGLAGDATFYDDAARLSRVCDMCPQASCAVVNAWLLSNIEMQNAR